METSSPVEYRGPFAGLACLAALTYFAGRLYSATQCANPENCAHTIEHAIVRIGTWISIIGGCAVILHYIYGLICFTICGLISSWKPATLGIALWYIFRAGLRTAHPGGR